MKRDLTPLYSRRKRLNYTLHDVENLYHFIAPKFKAIHIVGTNGKGSVAHHIARSMGNVGLFTSPHIMSPFERIQVGGEMIDEALFWDYLAWIENKVANIAFFDALFLIATLHFKELDIAIIEAGIGAKEDVTRCVDPILSILTTIGDDHMELIGPNIACDKAHVICEKCPVVVGHSGAQKEVLQRAFELKAPLYLVPPHSDYVEENKAIAKAALSLLKVPFIEGRVPARFEVFERGDMKVLVDVAHNRQGFARLAQKINPKEWQFITQFTSESRQKAFDEEIGETAAKSKQVCICGSFQHIERELKRFGLIKDFLNRR